MNYILLIAGFLLLVKGADFFVDGSSSLARILKVPSVIIGLTIVAMGTSAPEASVSINAALAGNNDIAVSNVIGSNIFNGLVVVGVCALLSGFNTDPGILKRDMPLNIIFTIALLLMLIDKRLGRIEGLILTTAMVTYIGSMVISALKNRTEDIGCKERPLPISVLFIAGGLAAVITGGNLTVNSASAIALSLGVSQNYIGLTIVAIGTSLPELVTSIVAAIKGDSGLALGNAMGSNLFNILFILGFSAIISPLHVKGESIIDCTVLIISAIALLIMAGTKRKMSKKEGITCLILYTAYMIYLFIR
ncbi:MAG: calcium/sodium antiporter [Lachnospiraceae bacterium]|nr:calcium/sodium antiporter [Lachnospiraceae bacterium]